jgi:hypothetical protein
MRMQFKQALLTKDRNLLLQRLYTFWIVFASLQTIAKGLAIAVLQTLSL